MRYKRKPLIVEAGQWNGFNSGQDFVKKFTITTAMTMYSNINTNIDGYIEDADGRKLIVRPGDYVVELPNGIRSVMSKEMFEYEYEKEIVETGE